MRLVPLPGVFQPPSDARMLAACMRREQLAGKHVLDLCTGSGALAIHAARRGATRVAAVDVSRLATLAVRLNAALNGVKVRPYRGDLFAPLGGERFDLVVSNPPYLPGPVHELPRRGSARAWEAGVRGRIFIDRICEQVAGHLRPGGAVLIVHSSLCDEAETIRRLREHRLRADVAASYSGPLGPIMRARADWLRGQGLLGPEDREDVVVVRGELPSLAPAQPGQQRRMVGEAIGAP